MNERRKALLGKFQATALERLRRISLALVDVGADRAGDGALEDIARELHTLKGEANMLRLPSVASVAHAAETLLGSPGSRQRPEGAATVALLRAADVLTRILRAGIPGEQEEPEIVELASSLTAVASASTAEAQRASAAPVGGGEPVAPDDAASPTANAEAVGPDEIHERRAVRWVQVHGARVDELCDRASDLAGDFRTLYARLSGLVHSAPLADVGGAKRRAVAEAVLRALLEDFDRCRMRLDDVAGGAWSLRLASVEPMLGELARHAYELAAAQAKPLRVIVRSGGAELERSLLDELWEPLVHLVRNAVDHGLEPASERGDKPVEALLVLEAHPAGPSTTITIRDDGRGIALDEVRAAAIERRLVTPEAAPSLSENELLDLLFLHGFSTRAFVTELSGRGVGLDVVRRKVESLGGSVSLSSTAGAGTQIVLTVPSTISKERALVLDVAGALFAVPSRHLVEVVRVADARVGAGATGSVLRYRDETIPIRSLAACLRRTAPTPEAWAIVIEWLGRRWAFRVASVVGEYDLVRRPVDALVGALGHIAASAVHDDGRLILILIVGELVRLSETRGMERAPAPAAKPLRARRRVLLVDDSPITGDLVSEILTGEGFDVELALDGRAALSKMDAKPFDLVLSDIDMPVMNGFELLRRIRAKTPHLPVIMLSTRASADDRREASQLGANAYIVKSAFHETALLETLRRFIGEAQ